jgi:hypothetical protein
MNDPAIQRMTRLMAFQIAPGHATAAPGWSKHTVLPPATYRPLSMVLSTSAHSCRPGCESASTNSSQSPVARAAPVFRAREIWFTGSNTTAAPASRATSAVLSVELLSQTMSSEAHPASSKGAMATRMLRSDAPRPHSSLKAGTMTEIFIP